IAAIFAVLGGILFIAVAVGTLLVGDRFSADSLPHYNRAATDGGNDQSRIHNQSMQGTFVLTLVFLVTFIILTALNWYLLSTIWEIGP
ncbi:MAG: cytochrome C oxidase subunit I, partial [Halobacteriaceae archaeon]